MSGWTLSLSFSMCPVGLRLRVNPQSCCEDEASGSHGEQSSRPEEVLGMGPRLPACGGGEGAWKEEGLMG